LYGQPRSHINDNFLKSYLEDKFDDLLFLSQSRVKFGKNAEVLEQPSVFIPGSFVLIRVFERVSIVDISGVRPA
jgi:hypothetical protein